MGIEQAREAAAAAARANPIQPKKLAAAPAPKFGAAVDVTDDAPLAASAGPAPLRVASLAKCGYYFEDASEELVKVTVPLEAACGDEPLPKDGAVACVFADFP